MILPLRYYGDPVLRAKTEPITAFDESLKTFVDNMLKTLYHVDGAGLAAPQVGVSSQLFILDLAAGGRKREFNCTLDGKPIPDKLLFPLVAINPKLEIISGPTAIYTEGCLSFKDLWLDIERPDLVHLEYQDINGNKHTIEADGILARGIQHEYDHLESVLHIDHVPRQILKRYESKLKRLRRETRDLLKKASKDGTNTNRD